MFGFTARQFRILTASPLDRKRASQLLFCGMPTTHTAKASCFPLAITPHLLRPAMPQSAHPAMPALQISRPWLCSKAAMLAWQGYDPRLPQSCCQSIGRSAGHPTLSGGMLAWLVATQMWQHPAIPSDPRASLLLGHLVPFSSRLVWSVQHLVLSHSHSVSPPVCCCFLWAHH